MVLEKGYIQIYTGEGKGKTTAALGLALRAAGHGFTVVVLQFLKGPRETGEMAAARALPGLDIRPVGRDGFIGPEGPSAEDIALAENGLREALRLLQNHGCDILILDEINVAVSLGCLSESAVLEVMDARLPTVELILTGRQAPPSFQGKADLVTTMTCTKHYFQNGCNARRGIEH